MKAPHPDAITAWHDLPLPQVPEYPDPSALRSVTERLSRLPPLVTSWEIESLRGQLAEAAAGQRFVLQGGDCSEMFAECTPDVVAAKLKILLQMSLVLVHQGRMPVTRVGRLAGQYAKPRSSPEESRDGLTLPVYRGDMFNGWEFDAPARRPDPDRMLQAYFYSGLTINFVRSLVGGGFADLHNSELWLSNFLEDTPHAKAYKQVVESMRESLDFMRVITRGNRIGDSTSVELFTSHEGLNLHYEAALTRRVPRRDGWYDLSCHFPWIGDRTRDPRGAHVAFYRCLKNPVGVKVGPSTRPDELVELVRAINPTNEPGRLMLIHRLGARRIAEALPPLVRAVAAEGLEVLWSCDPMHGNTEVLSSGRKTRSFRTICDEIEQAFALHGELGSVLGGLHIEFTGENVTECTGGLSDLREEDLGRSYKTHVDPRLNGEQALELAFVVAEQMARRRPSAGRDPQPLDHQ